METVEDLEIICDLAQATIGTLDGQTVALVREPTREVWREIRSALAKLDFDVSNLRLRQLGWWADGAELWAIEPA